MQDQRVELKSVHDRGLVKSEPHWSEITKHHDRYSINLVDKKSFKQELFGENIIIMLYVFSRGCAPCADLFVTLTNI